MGFFDAVTTGLGYASDAADVVDTGLNIASGVSGLLDDSAEDAYAAQIRALDQQGDMSERIAAIGDRAGGELSKAYEEYLGRVGDTGFFDPQEIANLSNFFKQEYGREFTNEGKAINNYKDEILRQGMGHAGNMHQWGDTFRDEIVGYADSLGIDPNYLAEVQAMDPDMAAADAAIAGANTDIGFREGQYDQLVNDLSSQYLDTFEDNTQREVDRMYSMTEADAIRKGMDRSTYDIEAKKGAMSQAKSMRDQDVIKAIDQALAHVGQRQQADLQNQQGRVTEFSGGMDRAGLGMKRAGVGMERAQLGMNARQQEINEKMRALEMSRGLNTTGLDAGRAFYRDGINTSSGLYDAGAGLRGKQYSLVPNRQHTAMGRAFGTWGNLNKGRQSGLNELTYTIGKPYEFQSTGASNAGQMMGNTASGWGNATTAASQARAGQMKALGRGLTSLSNTNWDSMFETSKTQELKA